MKIPKGKYLIEPLEFYPGGQIKGKVLEIGEKWTMDGEDWKKDQADKNEPQIGDYIVYGSSNNPNAYDHMINNKVHHIIGYFNYIL